MPILSLGGSKVLNPRFCSGVAASRRVYGYLARASKVTPPPTGGDLPIFEFGMVGATARDTA